MKSVKSTLPGLSIFEIKDYKNTSPYGLDWTLCMLFLATNIAINHRKQSIFDKDIVKTVK